MKGPQPGSRPVTYIYRYPAEIGRNHIGRVDWGGNAMDRLLDRYKVYTAKKQKKMVYGRSLGLQTHAETPPWTYDKHMKHITTYNKHMKQVCHKPK